MNGRSFHRVLALGGIGVAFFGIIFLAAGSVSNLVRVASAPAQIGRTGAGGSFLPVLSADNQRVVFISYAKDLVTNDDLAPFYDVFIRDLVSSNTMLVSVNLSGVGGGNDHSVTPTVSSNGQSVAFSSAAGNLVANDTNNASDIFLRDLSRSITLLVSVSADGTSANGPSSNPMLSQDGRFVVFESAASNLVLNDMNGASDVFVRDLEAGTTTLISVDAAASASANAGSRLLHISADGRYVAFLSAASDIIMDAASGKGEIFVRDWQTGVTYWGTKYLSPPDGFQVTRLQSALSADGRYLAFVGDSGSSSILAKVYRADLLTDTTVWTSGGRADLSAPSISADGQVIAFSGGSKIGLWHPSTNMLQWVADESGDVRSVSLSADGQRTLFLRLRNVTNGVHQLFLWDGAATCLISADRFGNEASDNFQFTVSGLSADGHRVIFETVDEDIFAVPQPNPPYLMVAQDFNKASDVFVRDVDSGVATLVSERHPLMPAPATGTALTRLMPGALSANGQSVIFASQDNVIVPHDTNGWVDVLMRNLTAGTNLGIAVPRFVSLSFTNSFPSTNSALSAAISADGRFVLSELSLGYPGSSTNAYRFDTLGTTTLISYGGWAPSVSADGRFAAVQNAQPLGYAQPWPTISDTNGAVDIVLGDFGDPWQPTFSATQPAYTRSSALISLNRLGTSTGNRPSWQPLVSSDARWVVFYSLATDLTTNAISPSSTEAHLFVRNLATSTTRLLDRDTNGLPLSGGANNPVFSLDSHYVFFQGATNRTLYRHDLEMDSILSITSEMNVWRTNFMLLPNLVICSNCDNPSPSLDGQLVTYEFRTNGIPAQILLSDLQAGLTELISVGTSGGVGDGPSSTPLLSYDGRYVVFMSKASNLVSNDFNGASDIFLRDRWKDVTRLISLNCWGIASANGPSSRPVFSAYGRTIAFQSFANDLVSGDYNDTRDIFVVQLPAVDNDGDGMEDDWERHYFGTLMRDGNADLDVDGYSDAQEFRAGTGPTQFDSKLQISGISERMFYDNGSTYREITVSWNSAPGRTYRLEFKTNLTSAAWMAVREDVTAGSAHAAKVDWWGTCPYGATFNCFNPLLFYRVRLLP